MNKATIDKITKHIRSFDPVALLQLLAEHHVKRHQIVYRGNPGTEPRPTQLARPTLLEKIEFDPDFTPGTNSTVVITVNLGLISCRSPLPSYLVALLGEADHGEGLKRILDILDNKLIGERLASFRPELDPRLVPDWPGLRRNLLALTSRPSPSRLHWIFQLVFPQIGVCVRRAARYRAVPTPWVRLGSARMGSATFGSEARVTVYGLEVTLIVEEPVTASMEPWTVEAKRRLTEQVFPVLEGTGIHLTVVLLFLKRAADAQFDDQSYLDYSPLLGGGEPEIPTRIILFSGQIPHAKDRGPTATLRASTSPGRG